MSSALIKLRVFFSRVKSNCTIFDYVFRLPIGYLIPIDFFSVNLFLLAYYRKRKLADRFCRAKKLYKKKCFLENNCQDCKFNRLCI